MQFVNKENQPIKNPQISGLISVDHLGQSSFLTHVSQSIFMLAGVVITLVFLLQLCEKRAYALEHDQTQTNLRPVPVGRVATCAEAFTSPSNLSAFTVSADDRLTAAAFKTALFADDKINLASEYGDTSRSSRAVAAAMANINPSVFGLFMLGNSPHLSRGSKVRHYHLDELRQLTETLGWAIEVYLQGDPKIHKDASADELNQLDQMISEFKAQFSLFWDNPVLLNNFDSTDLNKSQREPNFGIENSDYRVTVRLTLGFDKVWVFRLVGPLDHKIEIPLSAIAIRRLFIVDQKDLALRIRPGFSVNLVLQVLNSFLVERVNLVHDLIDVMEKATARVHTLLAHHEYGPARTKIRELERYLAEIDQHVPGYVRDYELRK